MIIINDLTFGYVSDKSVISGFSESFSAGERVCISAPSGGGKTTLLRLIAGLEKPQSGSIKLKDDAKIGMAFQTDVLLPWQTALENVANVCDVDAAKKWLTRFGLGENLNSYPDEMSGGMCRRVALARAVGYEPDVLLLDEPFKGLDSDIKKIITAELIEHFKERLIIFASHDEAETSRFATRIINL